ncbi:MAG TPA: accessory Sec system translocase SecA2 [Cellulomonas sp.]
MRLTQWVTEQDERRTLRRLRRTLPALAGAGAGPDPSRDGHVGIRAELDGIVRRTLGLDVHDEQWLAVLVLLDGRVVNLDTGEGKTLVGALAAVTEVRRGRRVHVATVNDYLAARDAEWMRPVYEAAGATVSAVTATLPRDARREAYLADVVYAPLTEIGFDLLRDGLVERPQDRVLDGSAPLDHLIVDEVDSLLVDQGRIPLVVAGAWGEREGDLALRAAEVVAGLTPVADFQVDEGRTAVWLTDRGTDRVEHAFGDRGLYDEGNTATLTAVNLALHARALVARDVDYLVVDGTVKLIDTARGRVAHLRRWPDGLQEAVEVRERLQRSEAGVILDQTTVPALTLAYRSAVGMSGTAAGAREELDALYRLQVVRVPPHRRCVRADEPVRVYATGAAADGALVERTAEAHRAGRPVLLGTQSVAASEQVAALLAAAGVPHVVLNAKNDEAEAGLVADAGQVGAVTVSTQMAGRGTDIRLGDGAAERGGLLVLARGLYPSSRLDDQLRGRSGRQGDPGGSAVYAALDDDLVATATDADWSGASGADGAGSDGADGDGEVEARSARALVVHAQRVAEGSDLATLQETWRYHAVIAAQRAAVQQERARVLERDDDLWRAVRLAVLDRAWSDHLGLLTDLRESVHLRVVARMNPWLTFNHDAEEAFATVLHDAREEADRLVSSHPDAASLADLGLRRPSATWTYVLHDTVLGDDVDRATRALRRGLGRLTGREGSD